MAAICAFPPSSLRTAAIPEGSHDCASGWALGDGARANAVRWRYAGRLSKLNWVSGVTRPTTTRYHRNCQRTHDFSRNPERKIVSNSLRNRSLSRKRPWRFLENDAMGVDDDPARGGLPEHLGQAYHRYSARADDVAAPARVRRMAIGRYLRRSAALHGPGLLSQAPAYDGRGYQGAIIRSIAVRIPSAPPRSPRKPT
jgi:hypothetical protein